MVSLPSSHHQTISRQAEQNSLFDMFIKCQSTNVLRDRRLFNFVFVFHVSHISHKCYVD